MYEGNKNKEAALVLEFPAMESVAYDMTPSCSAGYLIDPCLTKL
jgi:hypothetical protein